MPHLKEWPTEDSKNNNRQIISESKIGLALELVTWRVEKTIDTFLLKWAIPGLFFVYIRSFSNKHEYNFTKNWCEKCPSSIRIHDLQNVSLLQ